jgi:hypothetical protein
MDLIRLTVSQAETQAWELKADPIAIESVKAKDDQALTSSSSFPLIFIIRICSFLPPKIAS